MLVVGSLCAATLPAGGEERSAVGRRVNSQEGHSTVRPSLCPQMRGYPPTAEARAYTSAVNHESQCTRGTFQAMRKSMASIFDEHAAQPRPARTPALRRLPRAGSVCQRLAGLRAPVAVMLIQVDSPRAERCSPYTSVAPPAAFMCRGRDNVTLNHQHRVVGARNLPASWPGCSDPRTRSSSTSAWSVIVAETARTAPVHSGPIPPHRLAPAGRPARRQHVADRHLRSSPCSERHSRWPRPAARRTPRGSCT